MAHYKGRIVEILLEAYQNAAAVLSCPAEAKPMPGQYLQAHRPDNPMEVVPTSLFASGDIDDAAESTIRFPIAGPLPATWQPGTELLLRGPLGHGFSVPKQAKRISLVALDSNPGRLLPVVGVATRQGSAITLLHSGTVSNLSVAVEEQPLDQLANAIKWADYVAVDISIEKVEQIEAIFPKRLPAAVDAEILIATSMPCGGMAKCGICTVRMQRGPQLACEDGPVFKLNQLV